MRVDNYMLDNEVGDTDDELDQFDDDDDYADAEETCEDSQVDDSDWDNAMNQVLVPNVREFQAISSVKARAPLSWNSRSSARNRLSRS